MAALAAVLLVNKCSYLQLRPTPPRRRLLNVGECFCIGEILFRRLLPKTLRNANSLLSLLKALALRLLDCSSQFHCRPYEYSLM